jgi:hypothetical protein
MSQRRAKQRHDPVAHDQANRALITMDGFHHSFEHWIENVSSVPGIPLRNQFHRTL